MTKYVRYIPALTIVAFMASLLFDAGMFLVIGPDWMGFLSLQDLFSVSWPIVPLILFSLIGYSYEIALNFEPFKLLYAYRNLSVQDHHSWRIADLASIIAGCSSVLGFGAVMASPLISRMFGPLWVSTTLTGIALLLAPLSALFFWNGENQGPRRLTYYGLHIAIFIVAIGGDHARDEIYGRQLYVLRILHGTPVCGRILFTGSRGILMSNSTYDSRTFFLNEDVSRLDKVLGAKCPLATIRSS